MSPVTYLQHDTVTLLRHELGYEPVVSIGIRKSLELAVASLRDKTNLRGKTKPKGPVVLEDEVEILKHATSKAGVECHTWPETLDDRYTAIMYANQAAIFQQLAKAGLGAYRESNTRLGRRYYAVVKAKETIDSLAAPKQKK